jgi:glutathione synthase/RimK-type ligase-like ATP-grasp enzyme
VTEPSRPARRRIAVATCAAFPDLHADDRLLLGALAEEGVDARPVVWDAATDWRTFDAVLLRSTWDYHLAPERFRAWLDELDRLGVPAWNPTSLVRWNMDKRYLRELEAKGVPVVPTVWLDGPGGLEEVLSRGWDEVVVKPAVSAGAWRTVRARAGELAVFPLGDGLLVQPYLPEVAGPGELSLVFVAGEYAHAVWKRAAPGDFRVQGIHGGTEHPAAPDGAVVRDARAVLAAAPSTGLYARVDGVVRDGRLLLMELEQIEPYLFLAHDPAVARRLARALIERLPG